jgi:hypothetical protein
MIGASRGYLTLAARKAGFLEMAVDMALSLREHTRLPIALAADEQLAALAQTRYAGVFDSVTLIPPRFREGRALKYSAAAASPFQETVFVDADCIVLGPMDSVFDSLCDSDMAMTGEHLSPEEDRIHHGFSTRSLIRRFGLETYLKTNSGLFCFRLPAALEIMEECRACYENEVLKQLRWWTLLGKWLGDELAFGIVGGRRKLATLPTPHHMHWPGEFATLDLEHPSKPLLHMIWPPEPETLEALIVGMAARRDRAGVPNDGRGAHWREEVRKLARLSKRRRLFGRRSWY